MQRSCVTPLRERGRSTQIGHWRLTNSSIRCTMYWPHRNNQKRRRTIPKACPVALLYENCDRGLSLEQSWKRRRFLTADSGEDHKRKWSQVQRHVVQHIDRRCETRNKAGCFTLLKRITKLKTVNSEVKSVNSLPNRGSLQWVHGTVSELPWKSH